MSEQEDPEELCIEYNRDELAVVRKRAIKARIIAGSFRREDAKYPDEEPCFSNDQKQREEEAEAWAELHHQALKMEYNWANDIEPDDMDDFSVGPVMLDPFSVDFSDIDDA